MTAAEHAATLKPFVTLLGLFSRSVPLYRTMPALGRDATYFLLGLPQLMMEHGRALLKLASGPPAFAPSALVLARTLIETFASLAHTVLCPDPEWRAVMQDAIMLEGLKRRTEYATHIPQHQAEQLQEMQEVARLRDRLKAHSLRFEDFPPGLRDQVGLAGYGAQTVFELYAHLSDSVHGGYIAARQRSRGGRASFERSQRGALGWGGSALALVQFEHRLPGLEAQLEPSDHERWWRRWTWFEQSHPEANEEVQDLREVHFKDRTCAEAAFREHGGAQSLLNATYRPQCRPEVVWGDGASPRREVPLTPDAERSVP